MSRRKILIWLGVLVVAVGVVIGGFLWLGERGEASAADWIPVDCSLSCSNYNFTVTPSTNRDLANFRVTFGPNVGCEDANSDDAIANIRVWQQGLANGALPWAPWRNYNFGWSLNWSSASFGVNNVTQSFSAADLGISSVGNYAISFTLSNSSSTVFCNVGNLTPPYSYISLADHCGNGQVDSSFGEECDEGANNGAGGCTSSCQFAQPSCGLVSWSLNPSVGDVGDVFTVWVTNNTFEGQIVSLSNWPELIFSWVIFDWTFGWQGASLGGIQSAAFSQSFTTFGSKVATGVLQNGDESVLCSLGSVSVEGCGDGIVQDGTFGTIDLGEECDSAHPTHGVGCTNSCTRKVPDFSLSVTGESYRWGPIVSGNQVLVDQYFTLQVTGNQSDSGWMVVTGENATNPFERLASFALWFWNDPLYFWFWGDGPIENGVYAERPLYLHSEWLQAARVRVNNYFNLAVSGSQDIFLNGFWCFVDSQCAPWFLCETYGLVKTCRPQLPENFLSGAIFSGSTPVMTGWISQTFTGLLQNSGDVWSGVKLTGFRWGSFSQFGLDLPWTGAGYQEFRTGEQFSSPGLKVLTGVLWTAAGEREFKVAEIEIFHCGDGVKQWNLGEQCDDGDQDSGDGCSASCQDEAPVCGQEIEILVGPATGFVNFQTFTGTVRRAGAAVSAWDDLIFSGFAWGGNSNLAVNSGLESDFVTGIVFSTTGTQTFTGNFSNGTQSVSCAVSIEVVDGFGNGQVDPELGEECDDGNQDSGDGCGPTGKLEFPSCDAFTGSVGPVTGFINTQIFTLTGQKNAAGWDGLILSGFTRGEKIGKNLDFVLSGGDFVTGASFATSGLKTWSVELWNVGANGAKTGGVVCLVGSVEVVTLGNGVRDFGEECDPAEGERCDASGNLVAPSCDLVVVSPSAGNPGDVFTVTVAQSGVVWPDLKLSGFVWNGVRSGISQNLSGQDFVFSTGINSVGTFVFTGEIWNGQNAGPALCAAEVEVVNGTFCGDGIVQNLNDQGDEEECDDYNDSQWDGCSSCKIQPGRTCDVTSPPAWNFPVGTNECKVTSTNDGIIAPGGEWCDRANSDAGIGPDACVEFAQSLGVADFDNMLGVYRRVTEFATPSFVLTGSPATVAVGERVDVEILNVADWEEIEIVNLDGGNYTGGTSSPVGNLRDSDFSVEFQTLGPKTISVTVMNTHSKNAGPQWKKTSTETIQITVTGPASDCGDGVVEGDEQCDDGDTDYGDGCSEICEWEMPSCDLVVGGIYSGGQLVTTGRVSQTFTGRIEKTGAALNGRSGLSVTGWTRGSNSGWNVPPIASGLLSPFWSFDDSGPFTVGQRFFSGLTIWDTLFSLFMNQDFITYRNNNNLSIGSQSLRVWIWNGSGSVGTGGVCDDIASVELYHCGNSNPLVQNGSKIEKEFQEQCDDWFLNGIGGCDERCQVVPVIIELVDVDRF